MCVLFMVTVHMALFLLLLPLPPLYTEGGAPRTHTIHCLPCAAPPPQFTPSVIFSESLGEALLRLLHRHRHHTVVLPELITSSSLLLDQDDDDDTELNVCRTRTCRTFGTRSVGASSTTSTALIKRFCLRSTRVHRHNPLS